MDKQVSAWLSLKQYKIKTSQNIIKSYFRKSSNHIYIVKSQIKGNWLFKKTLEITTDEILQHTGSKITDSLLSGG